MSQLRPKKGSSRSRPWKGRGLGKLILVAALLAIAAFQLFRFARSYIPTEELAYYYDVSEQKLFAAPRSLIPPIRGLNDETEDAFRALVISTTGDPSDETGRKIMYLEKFSPELKQQIEAI